MKVSSILRSKGTHVETVRPDATCVVEIGFFTPSGRWRVDAATTFAAAG